MEKNRLQQLAGLSEESTKVTSILDLFTELNINEAQELFLNLHNFYYDNIDSLTNINAKQVSDLLYSVYETLQDATGA